MSFRINGGGAGGSGVVVWDFKTSDTFTNVDPDATKFIEIWDKNDPLNPEPTTAYVFVAGQIGWLNKAYNVPASETENYPPSCGAAFGYKKYYKGQIPEKVYAWRGYHQGTYPYPYKVSDMFGFNITPSRTGAMQLPNPGNQGMFYHADFIPADAVNNAQGNWTKVFNGGKGHWWDRPGVIFKTDPDGPGSAASIFGPGHDGGHYPAGTGGNGTDTARGPVAKGLTPGVLEEMGIYRDFIWGQAGTDDTWADNADFQLQVPPSVFMFGQGPIAFSNSLLKLPQTNASPPRNEDMRGKYKIIFSVMLEYR